MRAQIIQYNGSDGTGRVFADGRQYAFEIGMWRSPSVPAAGRVVEIELANDVITGVTTVPEDVLLREKATELGSKLSAFAGSLSSQVSSRWSAARADGAGDAAPATAGSTAGAPAAVARVNAGAGGTPIERYGKWLLGAYVVFVLATFTLNAVRMSMFGQSLGWSLFDIGGYMSRMGAGGGGTIKLVLIIAYAAALAPLVSHSRNAWLGLAAPLLAIIWAIVSALHVVSSLGDRISGEMANVFGLGFGFYLALISAVVLSAGGMLRYLRGA
jgi:hypothetical protein